MRAVGFAVVFAVALVGMITKAEAHAGNSSADVIHACKGNVLGVTRIVGVNGVCSNLESAVHWAIVGPAGATGPAGAAGPAGAVGPAGATGSAGTPAPVHAIGDAYGGGIVFEVDAEGQHGLIAALTDQGAEIPWVINANTLINAVRDGVNAGQYNTEVIIIDQGPGNYAAQLCANYKGGGYGDWYLPSFAELILMYNNIGPGAPAPLTNVGNFVTDPNLRTRYWSSTGDGLLNGGAYNVRFEDFHLSTVNTDFPGRARAVRSF